MNGINGNYREAVAPTPSALVGEVFEINGGKWAYLYENDEEPTRLDIPPAHMINDVQLIKAQRQCGIAGEYKTLIVSGKHFIFIKGQWFEFKSVTPRTILEEPQESPRQLPLIWPVEGGESGEENSPLDLDNQEP